MERSKEPKSNTSRDVAILNLWETMAYLNPYHHLPKFSGQYYKHFKIAIINSGNFLVIMIYVVIYDHKDFLRSTIIKHFALVNYDSRVKI